MVMWNQKWGGAEMIERKSNKGTELKSESGIWEFITSDRAVSRPWWDDAYEFAQAVVIIDIVKLKEESQVWILNELNMG